MFTVIVIIMGRLKNIRHETFVQRVVKFNGDQRKAYRATYGSSNKLNVDEASATNLMARSDIQSRTMEVMHLTFTPQIIQNDLDKLRNAKKGVWFNGERVGEENDNTIQFEILKLYMKCAGNLNNDTNNISQTNVTQFNVNVIDSNEALAIAKEVSALSLELKSGTSTSTGKVITSRN